MATCADFRITARRKKSGSIISATSELTRFSLKVKMMQRKLKSSLFFKVIKNITQPRTIVFVDQSMVALKAPEHKGLE
jgi:hypothetical protein